MFKRLTALALVGLLLAGSMAAPASAAGYDSLWEKISRQVSSGSGFKGEFALETQGSSLLAAQGLSLSGLQGKVAYVHDQADHSVYQLSLEFSREEKPLGSLFFFGGGESHALSGSLLPTPVKLPVGALKTLLEGERQERSWIPALAALAACEDEEWLSELAEKGESYRLQMEMWMAEYAQVSETVVDGVMTITYAIPAEAVKGEIQTLFAQLMEDEDMLALLGQLLTQEQIQRYLDPQWAAQYLTLLENIQLSGEVIIQRGQSVKGEPASTSVSLPLPGTLATLGDRLNLTMGSGHWEVSVQKGEDALSILWNTQIDRRTGRLNIKKGEVQAAAAFEFSFQERQWRSGEEDKDYESRRWTLTLTNSKAGEADYLAFEPLTLTYEDTFKSGTANLSPTYVEAKLTAAYGQGIDTLVFTGKSAAPWAMENTAQALTGARDLSAMTAAEQADWLTRAAAALAALAAR